MPSKYDAIVGQKFGRYTVVSVVPDKKSTRVIVACDCGQVRSVTGHNIVNGLAQSCGCLRRELSSERQARHRKSRTPIYKTWQSMKERCLNPTCHAYDQYGGRGIKICDRWLESFDNFYEDMGDRPAGTTLDRIDNNGGYSKENCRWATKKVQDRNRRTNRLLTVNGVVQTIAGWAEEVGISTAVIHQRLKRGWSPEDAVLKPLVFDFSKN